MTPTKGTRLRLLAMPDDPDPIPVGETGTVVGGTERSYTMPAQIWMKWDSGRSLALLVGVDRWEVLPNG